MLNLEKNRHYLLACSFGPDSMALFDMLLKEGYKFSVAHVNYHLRKESNEEESKLRDFCVEHNIGIYVRDVNEVLGESNLEMKCREIRYNFFISVMKENKFDALLVAHQEDDLIETYLMQKRRKNLVNYFGIKEISYFSDIEIVSIYVPDREYRNIRNIYRHSLRSGKWRSFLKILLNRICRITDLHFSIQKLIRFVFQI